MACRMSFKLSKKETKKKKKKKALKNRRNKNINSLKQGFLIQMEYIQLCIFFFLFLFFTNMNLQVKD